MSQRRHLYEASSLALVLSGSVASILIGTFFRPAYQHALVYSQSVGRVPLLREQRQRR